MEPSPNPSSAPTPKHPGYASSPNPTHGSDVLVSEVASDGKNDESAHPNSSPNNPNNSQSLPSQTNNSQYFKENSTTQNKSHIQSQSLSQPSQDQSRSEDALRIGREILKEYHRCLVQMRDQIDYNENRQRVVEFRNF